MSAKPKFLFVLLCIGLFALMATSSVGQVPVDSQEVDAYSGASDGDSDCDEDGGCEEDDGDIDCGCVAVGGSGKPGLVRFFLSLF